jgi:S-formylglutathione hydrolase FrmB
MNKFCTLHLLIILLFITAHLFPQPNIIDASFYSESLGEEKKVDIYIPPGYDENTDLYYPVIYFLHGWGGSQNSAVAIMFYADSLIRNEVIDPIVIVCADNGPEPFQGSFFMDSPIWGDYEKFNINDLISWVQDIGRVMPYRGYRAVMGQSMGGYGCFRYGTLYKHKFRAIAAHGSPLNYDMLIENWRTQVVLETGTEPPYFYDFDKAGIFTQLSFGTAGAFSPTLELPQDYISPQIVEFPLNELGKLIDTVYDKWKLNDPLTLIDSLDASDSVGILYGAGENDELYFYPPNEAFQDSLLMAGLPFEFFSHKGSHGMPESFMDRALKFIDSIVPPPNADLGINRKFDHFTFSLFPNPVNTRSTIQVSMGETDQLDIDLFNIHGDLVMTVFSARTRSGLLDIPFDATDLPGGVYFIQIKSSHFIKTQKIILQ